MVKFEFFTREAKGGGGGYYPILIGKEYRTGNGRKIQLKSTYHGKGISVAET